MEMVREKACQWALTQKRTLSGGGALEDGDHSLLEDGCERGGALVSDLVPPDTAKHGQGWGGERVRVSMGADTKANPLGGGALEVGDHSLLEDGSERGGALGSDGIVRDTASDVRDGKGEIGVSTGALTGKQTHLRGRRT